MRTKVRSRKTNKREAKKWHTLQRVEISLNLANPNVWGWFGRAATFHIHLKYQFNNKKLLINLKSHCFSLINAIIQ